ncbi:CHAT domain-containing protein [Nostoc sp. 'Peltigera membranacea cyanobiont' N6]|uniref:CHAT domain-containing protein n=1 Tax=Nostoc sp. 'Peltigera membranacea cyanobiont' N6 TaxID=1261031 RepID=UPI002157C1B5|nr:CHAT domain-containing protein [Nostoc sp. 'Peltigera membranacea cyanobiont' N6]
MGYYNRIRGEKAENIENAIAAFNADLTVTTSETFPLQWAMTQHNVGLAYRDRIRGNKAENIENAINAFNNALSVIPSEAFPQDWAGTQNNLGIAYGDRIWGEKAENIENAIAAFNNALSVIPSKAFPQQWAMTQDSLGNAYNYRIRGKKAENIENAIAAFNNALSVINSKAFPQQWAGTQNNLGVVYRDRIRGEKAKNIENAIAAFNDALSVYTSEAFPQQWAATQNNLGTAYYRGENAENIENAIAAFNNALSVYTSEDFHQEYATTQHNLGVVYRDRIRGEKAKNIENAIAAFNDALSVYTSEAFPQEHTTTLLNLGILYQNTNHLTPAYNTFAQAITTVEFLRGNIVSGEESKRKQAEEWSQLYCCMVETCVELGNITEAIEYLERSKTRNLVELILDRDLKTTFAPEIANKLEELQVKIASGQYKIQNRQVEDLELLAHNLQELRQQRNELLQNIYLSVGSGFKFDQFQQTVDQRTAIIEWYVTSQKIIAFVIKPNGQELTVWQSQPEDLNALEKWTAQYLQNYDSQKDQWQNTLGEVLKELASILHINEILTQIPPSDYDKLILIPYTALHLFPLHAIPVNPNSQDSPCLLDLFAGGVAYAPSCQLLQLVQQCERPDFQSLFAIQNPTGDLQFTDQEVNNIVSFFPSHEVLSNSHATKAALVQAVSRLQEVNYLHFSCHGHFKTNSPLDSFLLLADAQVDSIPVDADRQQYFETSRGIIDLSKCLTLGNLFDRGFDLKKCRLVVLSACETGLIDFNNNSDEYIGLPSGFLYAGSSSVVSSLWTVDDQSTAYLMIKFLQNLKASQDVSVAVALNQAQNWLRNITWEGLNQWTNNLQLDISNNHHESERSMRQMREILAKNALSKNIYEKPFQSPFHWAAFTAIGK